MTSFNDLLNETLFSAHYTLGPGETKMNKIYPNP